jgi:hypothetical protein
VRAHFLGKPQKRAYQRKGELASAWDLPQAKPIRGRHKESIFISFYNFRDVAFAI